MALVGAQFVNAVSPNPVGSLQAYAGASAPTGWLLCDGSQQAITAYPELYSVLGTTYGSLTNGSGGAGSTHFRVPDLRGRMPIGEGNDGTAANNATRTRGTKGGDTRLQQHNHTVQENASNGSTLGGHFTGAGQTAAYAGNIASNAFPVVVTNAGSGSGENMPPFLVTNYIIKAIPDAPRSGLAYGSTPPIVTALPANPQFGDVVTYIADATNGVAWNLQYDASGTYPWKFVGGSDLRASAGGSYGSPPVGPLTQFVNNSAAGSPTISAPLPGDYMVRASANGKANGAAAAPGLWISFAGSGPSNWDVSDSIASGTAAGSSHPLSAIKAGTVTSAGQLFGISWTNANISGTVSFYSIFLSATPIRVKAP